MKAGDLSSTGSYRYPAEIPYPTGYEPSTWVRYVVGARFQYWRPGGRAEYVCIGYDPLLGFWMQNTADERDFTNVSARAIGSTFHRVC